MHEVISGDIPLKANWDETMKNKCGMELAQAYVPFQESINMYSPEEGLVKGTIFPELNRPYHGRKGV